MQGREGRLRKTLAPEALGGRRLKRCVPRSLSGQPGFLILGPGGYVNFEERSAALHPLPGAGHQTLENPAVLPKRKIPARLFRERNDDSAPKGALQRSFADGRKANAKGLLALGAYRDGPAAFWRLIHGHQIHAHGRLPGAGATVVRVHGSHPVKGFPFCGFRGQDPRGAGQGEGQGQG